MKKLCIAFICLVLLLGACGPVNNTTKVPEEETRTVDIGSENPLGFPEEITEALRDRPIICKSLIDFGQEPSRRIHGIIISGHGFHSIQEATGTFKHEGSWYGLSYHNIIVDDKNYQMCEPEKIAYHAGKSKFPGHEDYFTTGVNGCTLGIGIPGSLGRAPSDKELGILKKQITSWYIENQFLYKSKILCARDVAPGRRTDPDPKVFNLEKFLDTIDWEYIDIIKEFYWIQENYEYCESLGMLNEKFRNKNIAEKEWITWQEIFDWYKDEAYIKLETYNSKQ